MIGRTIFKLTHNLKRYFASFICICYCREFKTLFPRIGLPKRHLMLIRCTRLDIGALLAVGRIVLQSGCLGNFGG